MQSPSSDPADPHNVPLRDWVRSTLGEPTHIEDLSRGVGRLSIVWRLTDGDRIHYVKQHESRYLFERERNAYERWVPRLREVPGVALADVRAVDEELGALLLTAVTGTHVSALEDDFALVPVYWHAGRFLRALHALPLAGDAPDMVAHMRDLIGRYVEPHGAHFESGVFDRIVAALDEGRPFADAPFVCAHRDYSPRNWFAAPDGTLGVIDWERAQPDAWLSDITRMEFDVWPARPELRDAFFKGYGTALTDETRHQLRLAVVIHAVSSVAWAGDRKDTHFEALGRATVARLVNDL